MTQVNREDRQGEVHFSIQHDEGLTVRDLRNLLDSLPLEAYDAPLTLCVKEIDSYDTRIVKVCNEGDWSHLWFELDPKEDATLTEAFQTHMSPHPEAGERLLDKEKWFEVFAYEYERRTGMALELVKDIVISRYYRHYTYGVAFPGTPYVKTPAEAVTAACKDWDLHDLG